MALERPIEPAHGFEDSKPHAIVQGLRVPGDETQLTNAIAAVARTDAGFARSFVVAVLEQAASDCPDSQAARIALESVPQSVTCKSEKTLYDRAGISLGRVDLLFESRDDEIFVLVIQNKLYAGFASGQLARYQAALRIVRGHGGRGGLVALTRDVPTRGELRPDDDEWLGSIRWARLLPRLRELQVEDLGVSAQWRLLLDVLDEQGDLGMTRIDADAVRAWSRYFDGRSQLEWLLEQVFATVCDQTQKSLAKAHRVPTTDAVALWYKPRARRVLIQQSQSEVQFGMSVPAAYTEQSLRVGFWMEDAGEVGFGVTVAPRVAPRLLAEGDRDFLRRVETLA
jgi:hypothetical protein